MPRKTVNAASNKRASESSTCQAKTTMQVKRKLFDYGDDDHDDTELLSTTKHTFDGEQTSAIFHESCPLNLRIRT